MVSGCLAVRLRLLNRLVSNLYDDALRPYGLRVSQMNILVFLAARGPLRGVDVARVLRLDTSTLSRDLDRMIEHGWVAAGKGVGRARRLETSDAGRALLVAVAPAWRKAQREAEALLTPAVTSGLVGVVDALWGGKAST
jgi:DNA-binding MarR family transcriptional regulator